MKQGRVHPDQGGRDRPEVAHDDGDRLVARLVLDAVADDPSLAIAGGQLGLGQAGHQLLAASSIGDQHLDREDRQVELVGDGVQALTAGDVDTVEDLAEHPGGGQAGEPGQVDGRLGMARTAEHPPFARDQGEHVPRPHQVARPRPRVDDRPDRPRPLLGADAGAARAMVHRHRERRAERGAVLLDHRMQIELPRPLGQDRHAELAPPVGDHEIDRLGRDAVGRGDEVALVLPRLVIHDDDHAPLGQGFECVFDFREFGVHHLHPNLVSFPPEAVRRTPARPLPRPQTRAKGLDAHRSPSTSGTPLVLILGNWSRFGPIFLREARQTGGCLDRARPLEDDGPRPRLSPVAGRVTPISTRQPDSSDSIPSSRASMSELASARNNRSSSNFVEEAVGWQVCRADGSVSP